MFVVKFCYESSFDPKELQHPTTHKRNKYEPKYLLVWVDSHKITWAFVALFIESIVEIQSLFPSSFLFLIFHLFCTLLPPFNFCSTSSQEILMHRLLQVIRLRHLRLRSIIAVFFSCVLVLSIGFFQFFRCGPSSPVTPYHYSSVSSNIIPCVRWTQIISVQSVFVVISFFHDCEVIDMEGEMWRRRYRYTKNTLRKTTLWSHFSKSL